jgi:hypothetical protein
MPIEIGDFVSIKAERKYATWKVSKYTNIDVAAKMCVSGPAVFLCRPARDYTRTDLAIRRDKYP